MGRTIGAVLLGYVVMFVAVSASLTGAYLVLGSDRAFLPGRYDPSLLWIVVSTVLGLAAAALGGWVAGRVDRIRAVRGLAVFVFVVGLLLAIPAMMPAAHPGLRGEEVSGFEAMQRARTPLWVALLNPALGVAGVLAGGRGSGGAARRIRTAHLPL